MGRKYNFLYLKIKTVRFSDDDGAVSTHPCVWVLAFPSLPPWPSPSECWSHCLWAQAGLWINEMLWVQLLSFFLFSLNNLTEIVFTTCVVPTKMTRRWDWDSVPGKREPACGFAIDCTIWAHLHAAPLVTRSSGKMLQSHFISRVNDVIWSKWSNLKCTGSLKYKFLSLMLNHRFFGCKTLLQYSNIIAVFLAGPIKKSCLEKMKDPTGPQRPEMIYQSFVLHAAHSPVWTWLGTIITSSWSDRNVQ